ncbi:MAG: iron ABC transporter permease [Chloroflexota bacterium]
MPGNSKRSALISLLLLFIAIMASIAFGAVFISPAVLWKIIASNIAESTIIHTWPTSFETILWQVRLPHTILMALTGAALASSGAAYQGLFRNPLADPYLIGVASGAGLGAIITLSIKWPSELFGFYSIPFGAFIGAIITVALVYRLARIGQTVPLTTLILAGIALGAFTSSITSYLMLQSEDQLFRALSFLFGGSPVSGWQPVYAILPYLLIGMGLLSLSGHILNVLQFGDQQAAQLGLPVERAKVYLIAVASLTAAAAVSFSGIIGFIGLIVPHVYRIFVGADYRRLLPLSMVGGAAALLFADLLARILLAPQSLPVGIITSLAGAPFFLWILRKAKIEVFW